MNVLEGSCFHELCFFYSLRKIVEKSKKGGLIFLERTRETRVVDKTGIFVFCSFTVNDQVLLHLFILKRPHANA
jgi:hypothetical protein